MSTSLPFSIRALARQRSMQVATVPFLLAPLLALSPLLRQPGYELATALGLLLAFLGGLPALALKGLSLSPSATSLPRGGGTDVPSAVPSPHGGGTVAEGDRERPFVWSPLRLFAWTLAIDLTLSLPAVLAALLASALATPCDPLSGFPFVLLLVPTSAVLCAATGTLTALWARDDRRALLAYYLLVLASAARTAWPIVAGPQVFAYNPFAGYFPGPIYDEAMRITPALLWSRLEALGWAGAALALASARAGSRLAWAGLAAALALVLGLRLQAGELGLATTTEDVAQALGGVRETEHFVVHYPRERSRVEVERLARDLEFRYAQDSAFLGTQAPRKIQAFFYRSADEKRRWVGAAETDFAKPWLGQFHLQLERFPDGVMKHELAHVLAGNFGVGPFKVSGGSLLPNAGLIEGLATAADDPVEELTLDQWAAAMRRLKLAPDTRALFSAAGFWSQEQGRAYTAAGSFLRFIAQRCGTPGLQRIYSTGDFQAACGAGLEALITGWEAHLDAVPLDDRALHVAQRRFSAQSLFTQACARETANLREEAGARAGAEPEAALRLFARLEALETGNPGPLFGAAEVQRGLGKLDEARATLERLLALPGLGEQPKAQAQLTLADLDLQAQQPEAARGRLQQVLALAPDRATTRAAEIRLQALADPQAEAGLLGYFREPGREDALLSLAELAQSKPALASPRYLLGRRLTDAELPEHALRYLEGDPAALAGELPEVAREWLRLRLRGRAMRLECPGVEADRAALLALDGAGSASALADAAFADDWLARCRFELQTYRTPAG